MGDAGLGGGEGGREGGKGVGEGGREGGKVRSLAGSSNTVISGEEREEGRKPLFTGGKMKIKKDRENVTISQVGGQGGGGQRENRQWEEVKEMSGRRQGRSWRGTKREEKGNRKKDGRGEGVLHSPPEPPRARSPSPPARPRPLLALPPFPPPRLLHFPPPHRAP